MGNEDDATFTFPRHPCKPNLVQMFVADFKSQLLFFMPTVDEFEQRHNAGPTLYSQSIFSLWLFKSRVLLLVVVVIHFRVFLSALRHQASPDLTVDRPCMYSDSTKPILVDHALARYR